MMDRRSSRPTGRPAHRAGRLFLRALGVLLALPCWLFWLLAILLLPISRPLVQFPLGFGAVGGLFAGVLFARGGAWGDAWGDAATAIGLGLAAAMLLAVYTAVAEKIDPQFSRPTPWPPWWWYF